MSRTRWSRPVTAGVAMLAATTAVLTSAPAAAGHPPGDGSSTITLPGSTVAPGSKFEGIGLNEHTGTFYVSETTGGEISRGNIRANAAQPWLPGDGADGRWTARGITVDREGRVYIAGGPNGIDHTGAPDLWVYSPGGRLLAKLDTGIDNAFLNDVVIGPDGAAYFTNSNSPQIFRVAHGRSGWQVSTFVDATGAIPTSAGFNLGGIVATPDGRALVVAQGNVGALWRFDLRSKEVSRISGTDPDPSILTNALTNADGLVLRGHRLLVIRNFSRSITTLKLSDRWNTAALLDQTPTDPGRVLTTGKLAGNRLYAVDSKFDENPAVPPYEVVVLHVR
jgi:sugar lactone lactonase YvrE